MKRTQDLVASPVGIVKWIMALMGFGDVKGYSRLLMILLFVGRVTPCCVPYSQDRWMHSVVVWL